MDASRESGFIDKSRQFEGVPGGKASQKASIDKLATRDIVARTLQGKEGVDSPGSSTLSVNTKARVSSRAPEEPSIARASEREAIDADRRHARKIMNNFQGTDQEKAEQLDRLKDYQKSRQLEREAMRGKKAPEK